MAFLTPDSFYTHHYQAARSSAFGGTLGKKTVKPKAPAPAPPPSGPQPTFGPPQGFTASASTLPPDPAFDQAMSGITGTRDNTLGSLTQARTSGLATYGYTEDPTTHALAYDPNNPYSQAALLRQHYQQSKTGSTNSYAASGQGYAGSLQNAQDENTRQFNIGDNSLLNAVRTFLANNTTAQNNAISTFDTNAGTAFGQRVTNAPGNPLYQPASAAAAGGATTSVGPDGTYALTAGAGGSALVPQQKNSTVKLASGWSIVYDASGRPIKFVPPGG